jgi:hypothetical protein
MLEAGNRQNQTRIERSEKELKGERIKIRVKAVEPI